MNTQLTVRALEFLRALAADWEREGNKGDTPGTSKAAYDLLSYYEQATPCRECQGNSHILVYGYEETCAECHGTGVDYYEDAVLRATSGPVFYSKTNLLRIALTGRERQYQPYLRAARKLTDQGLLYKAEPGASPNEWFGITDKGLIARWALLGGEC